MSIVYHVSMVYVYIISSTIISCLSIWCSYTPCRYTWLWEAAIWGRPVRLFWLTVRISRISNKSKISTNFKISRSWKNIVLVSFRFFKKQKQTKSRISRTPIRFQTNPEIPNRIQDFWKFPGFLESPNIFLWRTFQYYIMTIVYYISMVYLYSTSSI